MEASKAQDTADGKRRVFTVTPKATDAYDVGDLWTNATAGTYSNDLLRCKTPKAVGVAFSISHWEKASKYTDDTAVGDLDSDLDSVIVSTVIEYALSDLDTTEPLSGWNTTAPQWKQGMYLWSRTVATPRGFATKPTQYPKITGKATVIQDSMAIPYQAGEWISQTTDSSVSYVRTPISYPIVSWKDSGGVQLYYALQSPINVELKSNTSPNADTTNWKLVDSFQTVMTEILVADVAKLESFVFNGGRMFSQQGNMQDYTDANFIPNIYLDGEEGNAKMGDLFIDENGMLYTKDPVTGEIKFKINTDTLPSLQVLLGDTLANGSVQIAQHVLQDTPSNSEKAITLPGSIDVTETGAEVKVQCELSASCFESTHGTGFFSLYLKLNGQRYMEVDTLQVSNYNINDTLSINMTFPNAQKGVYELELWMRHYDNLTNLKGEISPSTLSWNFKVEGVQRFEYGKNGMMAFYSNNHIYMDEVRGWDVRGKTNMPGTLLSATVASGGGWSNVWGAKTKTSTGSNVINAARNSTGRYTVSHSLGHSRYQVFASAHTANRSHYVVSKGVTSFVIEWRSIGSSPALVDTLFDVSMIGDNY